MKKQKKTKDKIIRRLLREARPIWKWLIVAALLCCGVIACSVAGPNSSGRSLINSTLIGTARLRATL